MLFRTLALSALFFTIALQGCKKPLDVDLSAPLVTSAMVNQDVVPVTVAPGDTLYFDVAFTDENALLKYRILIEADYTPLIGFTAWSFTEVFPLDPVTSATASTSVVVPDSLKSGAYTIAVEAMDVESNLSSASTFDLTVTNIGQPTFSISAPNLNNDINANTGDTLNTNGSISDNTALTQVDLTIAQETEDGLNTIYLQKFTYPTLNGFTYWDLDTLQTDSIPLRIPTTASAGIYELTVGAYDTVGNYSSRSTTVIVNE